MKISEILKINPSISSKKLFATLFPDFVKREKEIYGIIYCFTSPDGKKNIGKTTTWRIRFKNYRGYHCKNQPYFYNALKLHGFDNFNIEILCECNNEEELKQKEVELIQLHKSKYNENGYNIEDGGQGGKRSEETKRKISESLKGEKAYWYGKKMPPEMCKKLSDAKQGENHPLYGKKHTEESKKKNADSQKRELSHNFNPTIYVFFNNRNEEVFIGTYYDFRHKYNLPARTVSALLLKNTRNQTCKDWIFVSEHISKEDTNNKIDIIKQEQKHYIKLYKFYNPTERKELVISQLDFRHKFNVSGGQLSILINRIIPPGRPMAPKSIVGWFFIGEV